MAFVLKLLAFHLIINLIRKTKKFPFVSQIPWSFIFPLLSQNSAQGFLKFNHLYPTFTTFANCTLIDDDGYVGR